MTDEQTGDGERHSADLDAAVHSPAEDRYGFTHVAKQLAVAIGELGRDGSAVIGLEGAWGSGKTSLLNLLRLSLEAGLHERTFVLSVSPWLDGGSVSPVESLLLPVAAIIAEEEKRALSAPALKRLKRKKALTDTASKVLRYSQSTARHLGPVAEMAALVPGMPNASGALKAYSDAEFLTDRKTTAELRTEIGEKITALDLSFIVVMDDLDRLEPAQAVEIVRLVKSVADFPRFRYVLSYDKAVLAHAIQTGLGVTDGAAYLQKIVQISFSLPRPEAFSLRREFISGVKDLYLEVNGNGAGEQLLADLKRVADVYGAALSTPREVKLVLNILRFRYVGVRDYVYLPDLCLLQLIRVSNAGLYDWIEQYLTERAVVESRDGSVSDEGRTELKKELLEYLDNFPPSPARKAYNLGEWVPGITGFNNENITLFSQTRDEERAMMTAHKRLGSGAYWRYYFAFSSPQNVLPPAFFDDLFSQAADPAKQDAMAELLLGKIDSNNVSSRTWFEHILSQLSPAMVATQNAAACEGLVRFFFDYGDEVIHRYHQLNVWFAAYDLDIDGVVDRLIQRMCEVNRAATITFLQDICVEGNAWSWIARYVRHLMWQNGLVGDRPAMENDRVLSNEELVALLQLLAERLNQDEIRSLLLNTNDLLSYLYAWRDIDNVEHVRTWAENVIQTDEGLLQLLLRLRGRGISSATGRYLSLDLSGLSEFLGESRAIEQRLDHIEAEGKYLELMKEIRASQAHARF
ncbi:KAP family P-loop NTPase fold protein [Rahnella variigena]|uniref:KAP family P-loop NTPase fold protein n=1 Tax=Rahnella variigena TaxID=574964 RepID=UPI0013307AFE|nr:P-loop NTPase fold protein [Rahnella variigena]